MNEESKKGDGGGGDDDDEEEDEGEVTASRPSSSKSPSRPASQAGSRPTNKVEQEQ